VSVGERPELPDQENTPTGRGKSSAARGKRGRPRRIAAAAELDVTEELTGNGAVAVANGGRSGGGRDRGLRRLLAGLRSLDAGDFNVRLDADGDSLMSEISDIFNSVATKQGARRRAESRGAVVGREGKMRDRATIGPPADSWAGRWTRSIRSSPTWCSRRRKSPA
jgi:hypothetical protein